MNIKTLTDFDLVKELILQLKTMERRNPDLIDELQTELLSRLNNARSK